MKIIFKYLVACVSVVTLATSCINSNLEELPLFDGKDILQVNTEWRYNYGVGWNGEPLVKFQKLNRNNQVINKELGTVTTAVGLPQVNDGQGWTVEEQAKVTLTKLAVMVNLDNAAKIAPIGDAPLLGVPADWTTSHQYTVTAADGGTKVWTITITGIDR